MSPKRRRRGLLLNVGLVVVLVALGVVSYLVVTHDDTQPAAAAATVQVARGTVTATVTSSGTVQSARTASPQFAASGTVTAVLVSVGQHVTEGQALARIGSAPAQRALTIAEYNLTAARNAVTAAAETLDDAEEAAEEAEEAEDSGTTTTTTQQGGQGTSVASATASLAKAKADRESAEQNVDAAQDDVTATTLRAPIAGTITAVNGSVGSVTGSGSSNSSGSATGTGSTAASGSNSSSSTSSSSGFFAISDLTALRVVASFPEADALRIKAGQAATVTFNAAPDTPVTAKLTSVSPTPTTTNGVVAYDATFTLGKVPAGTRLGQTADISVTTAKASNAIYVPTMAITTAGSNHTVTMADGQSRTVQIGVEGDTYTQVTSGLAAGDQIQLASGRTGAANSANRGQLGGPGQIPGQGTGQLPAFGQQQPGANRGR